LGVLAGGGDIPRSFLAHCAKRSLDVFVVGFEGQTDPASIEGVDHLWARLGAAGRVLKALKKRGVYDLVFIGKIRRPSLKELRPDLKTAEFFAKEGLKAFGDDGLLKGLRRFLEKEGFRIYGVQDFMPDLLTPAGAVGAVKPSRADMDDIARGIKVLQAMAPLDIGQAVIVQQDYVLGVEGAEGTDELIRRCGLLQRGGRRGILVKLCKDGQDTDLDLPTIGPQTIESIVDAGLGGVAVHAGRSFVHELDTVREKADEAKVFVIGVEPESFGEHG
jgi:hypothetical protein